MVQLSVNEPIIIPRPSAPSLDPCADVRAPLTSPVWPLQFDVELHVCETGAQRSAPMRLQSAQSAQLAGVRVLVVGEHAARREIVAAHLRR